MRRPVAGLVALAVGLPGRAGAHAMLDGMGDFGSGLLHPLVVPAEALALLAVALLLGTSGRAACRAGLLALAGGLAAGVVAGRFLSITAPTALIAVAFLAAGMVAAGLRLPPVAAALIAAAAGATVGVDAHPEAAALRQILIAGGAVILGATSAAMMVASFVLGREHGWQSIAIRVVGSWITASAILYFAWLATSSST